jgi:uncharacterized protein YdcH (DUF465 family)
MTSIIFARGDLIEVCAIKMLKTIMQKHDILHEFPELASKVHDLKISNNHFRKIFDEYHELDHEIHSIESGAVAVADEHLNELRRHRVHLKDSIFRMLQSA